MRTNPIRCFFSTLVVFFLFLAIPPAATASDVARATLKNGLRVVVVRNTLAPVASVQVNYLVGGNEAPAGFPGMAHAQEHMMFRGSPDLSAAQLASLIAALGGEFNADTQQAVTQYFLTVPKEDLDLALHLEAIRMHGVLDSEKLWQQERGAIEQEVVQDLSNPGYQLQRRLLAGLFAGTPYEHDGLGTRPSFDQTTGAMLKKFHDDWYAPNNAILIIVGDCDPDKVLDSARTLFEPIPARPLPPRPTIHLQPLKAAQIGMKTDQPYGVAVVAYRLPGFDSPDYAAAEVLGDVLASRRGELYALVPQGKALSAGFDNLPLAKAAAGYATAEFPKGGDGQGLIAGLKGIVQAYVKNGFPAELVETSKRKEIAQAEFLKNSVTGLADAWSQALAVEGLQSPDDEIAAIAKVTVADVNRVAREYLVNDTAITALLKPEPSGKPVVSEGSRGKESFAPQQTKPAALPGWAKMALEPGAASVISESPNDIRLPNGLRLIVQPSTISKTVSLYGGVRNKPELEEAPGKEGVAGLLGELFSYGTATMDRLAFQKALDDISADASAGTSFSLQVLSRDLDRGVELLADNLLHPALPEKAFEIARQQGAEALAGRMQSPAYLAQRALLKALYPKDDPKQREATPATLGALSLEDVKAYYRKVFRPDLTTIVVIGDISPERAKAVVERYFGKWRAVGPQPPTVLPPVPRNQPSVVTVPDRSRVQDEVMLMQTLGLTRSNPDYYPLQLGLHVLSGAFYATRLYRDLREKSGLVYTVEAFLEANKSRSVFGIAYGCDPQNVSKAKGVVERNLREIQQHDISAEELRQAKVLLIRQLPLSRASMRGTALSLLDLALEDLPLDEPDRALTRYRETKAGEVRAAFTKWVRPKGFAQVTRGPNPH
jgi:zinc protease